MDTLKKIANRKLIAIMMVLMVALEIISIIGYIYLGVSYQYIPGVLIVFSVIEIVGTAIIAYCLFANQKNIILLVGTLILLLPCIYYLVAYFTILDLFSLFIWFAVCLLVVIVTMSDKIKELNKIKKYAMIIGNIIAVIYVLIGLVGVFNSLINIFRNISYGMMMVLILNNIFVMIKSIVSIVSFGLFIVYMGIVGQGEENPNIDFSKMSDNISKVSDNITKTASEITSGPMSMSMGLHIVLLLCTCGIWHCIWIYKVTGYLNNESAEKREPINQLLLCMFLPFYHIYWSYKSAGFIDEMYRARGKKSDITTLCLILGIFINVGPAIVIQDKINGIEYIQDTGTTTGATQQEKNQNINNSLNDTDEIREYKKLLDDGLITEEEFEAKKKQIMGL